MKIYLLETVALMIQLFVKKETHIDLVKTTKELASNVSNFSKTYDFIIVGGGTAGCLLAGRLSEHFNVLLLEAGGYPPPEAAVPHFSHTVRKDPDINFFFKTVNMTNGGVVTLSTGKMLGGSGSHNDMIHNRGSPKDYDNIAVLLNDSSWKYENIVKYFKKSETFKGKQFGNEDYSRYYGTDGPIRIESEDLPILPIWFAAGKELGFNVGDPNGYQSESFTALNKPTRNGQRSSTYTEFVKPYKNTKRKLTVIRYANVSEILIKNKTEAYGVAYTRHGIPQISYASKEVILSAGVFSSPLLLMKSGIGPAAILEAAGIPVKVSLPAVGENISEHPALILPFVAEKSTLSLFPQILTPGNMTKIVEEFERGKGPLTLVGQSAQCFKVSSKARKDWPNLSVTIHLLEVKDIGKRPMVNFFVILGRPRSKGSLKLKTTAYRAGIRDDVQLAEIDFNTLGHPDDVEDLLEGVKLVFNITQTLAFQQNLKLSFRGEGIKGCSGFQSDDYWRCHIKKRVASWIHMGGSAKLGPDSGDAKTYVLDTRFRVRGVKSLRVVDASVFPEVPNANLNAPVMMVAEKAAENIIEDWTGQGFSN